MSTRSTIGILGQSFAPDAPKFDDNRPVTSIYCHSDGYLEHNGALLDIFYNEPQLVEKLISYGHMSSLGYVLGVKHDFNKRGRDMDYYEKVRWMCCFYHRDRDGLDGVNRYPLEQYKGNLGDIPKQAYTYVYVPEDKAWYVLNNGKWYNLHKRLLAEIPKAADFINPLARCINPQDKEGLAKLKAYGKAFDQYRKQHPYVPSYEKLKDENDSRDYCMTKGFYVNSQYKDIQYKVIHIDNIVNNKSDKVVTYTMKDTAQTKKVNLIQFLQNYFNDESIVLKNTSKFTAFLPK